MSVASVCGVGLVSLPHYTCAEPHRMFTCRASHVKTGNRAKHTQSVHVRDTMDCLIAGDVCRAEKCGNMSAGFLTVRTVRGSIFSQDLCS